MIPFRRKGYLFIAAAPTISTPGPSAARLCSNMATQTMITMPSQILQKSKLLHLVGSKDITPHPRKRSSSVGPYFSVDRESPLHRPPIIDSFDAPPESSVWKIQPPANTSKIRQSIANRYYQYEVTWGLYVLTPGEKVVINSIVFIMFSLTAYTIANIAVLQQTVRIIVYAGSALVEMAYSMARLLCDWVIFYVLGMGMELKAFGELENTMTLLKRLSMVLAGKFD